MANSVTAMFYLIDATTGKDALVEGGEIARPPWLGFSVHVFNTIVAWADIFCAYPRSFSTRSGRLSVGIIAFYTVWILICSHYNGAFPYPILNQLPYPAVGFLNSLDLCCISSVPCALLSCADCLCAYTGCCRKSTSTLPGLGCFHVVMLCLCYLGIPLVVPGMLNLVVDLQGFIGMATTSIILFYLMFLAGRQLCKRLLLKRAKVE